MRVEGNSYTSSNSETTNASRTEAVQYREPSEPVFRSNVGDRNFQTDVLRFSLTQRAEFLPTDAADPQPIALSPHEALDQINQLPVPSLDDPVATRAYQQQRAELADTGLQNAQPPTRADFESLPPRLADMEYQDALTYYNGTVSELEAVSIAANADLQTEPTALLGDSAQRVRDAAERNPQEGAAVLAREIEALNAKYGPEAGGQLIAQLYEDSKNGDFDLTNVLSFAGGDETSGGLGTAGLPEAQREAIGTAVGQAYDSMSPEDRAAFIDDLTATIEHDGFRGNALGGDTARVADIIARGDSSALENDLFDAVTKRMVEIQPKRFGNNGGVDVIALANSAAILAGGAATGTEQAAMFNRIIQSFPEMHPDQLASLMEDPALKDNLGKVFINNSEAIMRGLTNEQGDLIDPNSMDGLRQFFEMTMFSRNGGELREQVMGEAVRLISEFADPTAAPTAGREKTDDARTAGSLIGLVQAAAINQREAIQDDQKSREETTKMFVGMAFAFAPGASEVLGEGSATLLEFAYEQGKEYAQENAQSGLGGLINNLVDGDSLENISEGFKAIRELRFQVSNSLENRGDLYEAFNDGYTLTGVDQLFAEAFDG